MKKGILIGMGILFIAVILNSGCSKPEEKKAEAPAVKMETVQQKAAAVQEKAAEMKQEAVEMPATVESAVKESATMTKQEGTEALKEMGQQAMDNAVQKMPEEAQQAVEAVKQLSGDQSTMEAAKAASGMKVPAVETPPVPMETPAITEQTLKEKAIEQGMKLPSKY